MLSQFSRNLKTTPTDGDDPDDSKDLIELKVEQQLDMLEDEINCPGVGDEELTLEDNEDEIAGDVASSDNLVVNKVIRKAHLSIRVDALPAAQANIGRVCIVKASAYSDSQMMRY